MIGGEGAKTVLKLSIITLFLGQTRNRFLIYQDPIDIGAVLDRAGASEGCGGVELRYPVDFADLAAVKEGLARNALGVSAINFASVRNDRWLRGAWTSENPADRQDAIDDFRRCLDIADELGTDRVTNCPLNDGFDYPFEIDYPAALDRAAACYDAVAAHDRSKRICIEYKISEPRVRALLGTAGESLAFVQMVGADNLGVTMDTGHAFFAQENPAHVCSLLARAGKLFYVHLNDNDCRADWDLTPGSFHTWEFVELFFHLNRMGFDDWFTFDIVPKEHDPAQVFTHAARITNKLSDLAKRISTQEMERLLAARNPTAAMDYLHTLV